MRSMLFVPGDKEKLLLKSLKLGADAVIWDLEDAVAFGAKQVARETIAGALQIAPTDRVPIYVRVNNSGAELLGADLERIMQPGLDGIIFPKAESSAQVKSLDSALARLESDRGLPQERIKVLCLLDTEHR